MKTKNCNYCISFSVILLSIVVLVLVSSFTGKVSGGVKALKNWQVGTIVTQNDVEKNGETNCFKVEKISDAVFNRMKGKSYIIGCPIKRDDLRYIKALHKNINGQIIIGEMVVNKAIANDVLTILRTLYRENYAIERMRLIDDYGADDERSMRDNNTSAFCYRAVSGTKTLSAHAQGLAVDINTLYNPYFKIKKDGTRIIQPATAKAYCDRTKKFQYKIEEGDLCHRLFIKYGFTWGGSWQSCKDYQHFEKAK